MLHYNVLLGGVQPRKSEGLFVLGGKGERVQLVVGWTTIRATDLLLKKI